MNAVWKDKGSCGEKQQRHFDFMNREKINE